MVKAVLPESLEYLGMSVFNNCSALWNLEFNCINLEKYQSYITGKTVEKITVGPKVKRIPFGLYSDNANITSIDLPASVEIIDANAFRSCSNLISVNIPGRIKELGESAFASCSMLRQLAPIDVEVIPSMAFMGCENLDSIWISDRTKIIGEFAFEGCSRLNAMHWPLNLKEIGNCAFQSCNLQVISLPEGVKHVGSDAFGGCNYMRTLYIPSTLTEYDNAFRFDNDDMYSTITCMLPEPPSIREYAWNYNHRVDYIKVPVASLEAYKQHPDWISMAHLIASVEGIETISDESSTNFASRIDDSTDLSDTVVGDVYITIGNGDSYDSADGSIVLSSTMEEEYVESLGDLVPGESDIANRFNGLVVNVAAGQGTVSVDCQTIGENLLAVKIGNSEPQNYKKDEKGFIDVDYNVAEDTYVYIYGSKQNARPQQMRRKVASRAESENCIRIYAVNVKNSGSGVEDILDNADNDSPVTGYFTIDGCRVAKPSAPGFYIVRRANNTSEKVYLK